MRPRIALFTAITAAAMWAVPLHAGVVNEAEQWAGGDLSGWECHDLVNERAAASGVVQDGAAALTFPRQSMRLPPEEWILRAGSPASGGRFAGDYLADGVCSVSFRLKCDRATAVALALCNEEARRLWRFRVSPVPVGDWGTVTVPVDLQTLRSMNGVDGWQEFATDLQNVSWIGVIVERDSSMDEQTYLVDDFTLLGPGTDFATWMAQFGQPADGDAESNTLPGGDLDRDGADNYDEWVAGTSAGGPEDALRLEVGLRQGTNAVSWDVRAGRSYSVWRSSDLPGDYTNVSGDLAPAPGETTFQDAEAEGRGPHFYRLEVRREE